MSRSVLALLVVVFLSVPGVAPPAVAQEKQLEDRYVEANGVHLHYVTAGSGPLIIFLHGFPEFWYQWKPQLAEFSKDFQVVALDMRGYNLSSKPGAIEAYQIKHLVEDVHAVAKSLGRDKFILVGQDWGGVVAWAFALYHPEQLDRLVVLNAPHPTMFDREIKENPAQQWASRYMLTTGDPASAKNLANNDYQPLVEMVLGAGLRNGSFNEADRAAYVQAWSQPGALQAGLNYYRAAHLTPPDEKSHIAANGNYTPDLRSTVVKVPTLLIWGMQDRYILTGNLTGIRAYVPSLTLKLFPDASHWINHEKAGEVNAAMREFFMAPK